MGGMQWVLELVLVGLLAATLFHALRLERALGVLKRDRSALEALVATFNASTRAAEAGIDRLHVAAEGAGRQIARQAELAASLKDDLVFLTERGDRLADRLDVLVRSARPLASEVPATTPKLTEPRPAEARAKSTAAADVPQGEPGSPDGPRVRSQAERDLLRALRMAR